MAKQKGKVVEKPIEILELEKEYNVILNFSPFTNSESLVYDANIYNCNDEGEIVALSIINTAIENFDLINKFLSLEYLDVSANKLKDLSTLKLPSLKHLYLGNNSITDITPLLTYNKLKRLALWSNPIKDFFTLNALTKLEALYCQNTGFNDLHIISNLDNLQFLRLEGNNIVDINPIKNLKKLYRLHLDNNRIENIEILKDLPSLAVLTLSDNQIKQLPKVVAERFNWLFNSLYLQPWDFKLYNNPLHYPPPSVIALGPEVTKNYYETAEQFGSNPLSEGRIIVIGDGASGKSSLIERTLYNSFEANKTQTNGIKIDDFQLPHPEDKRDLTFHIWDFGGQEIQHAVHKFFFTEGCLYVLVLDSRKEEEPEYWLQQIESLGGGAPVLVVFNKQDENAAETVDRKFLKEKYPNIIGFYKTSCKTGFGIPEFKKDLEKEVVKLRTVEEHFPKNWLEIKKAIEACTSGSQHYLTFEAYREICKQNHTENEEAQKLLLKYFNTIGAITWFGDNTALQFLHVLSPEWITQGVYKIITAKKTALLFGQIRVSDFKELLQPTETNDYIYDEAHYGYILRMMQRFDLCYTEDEQHLLIPSAFGKEPKVEYSEFKGTEVRTYFLQFKEYMPLALIHRFIKQRLGNVLDHNYWYTGIVIQESKTKTLAMVHADREAKRIYIRIKGKAPLGFWEGIRHEFANLASNYAKLQYEEQVMLDESKDSYVSYDDLISYLQAHKAVYYHPKLQKDFNVGYLLGLFEKKNETLKALPKNDHLGRIKEGKPAKPSPVIVNILNQNSAQASAQVQISIDIDIEVVQGTSAEVQGEAQYLAEKVEKSNEALLLALHEVIRFAQDAARAQNSGDVKAKGWGRKLKESLETLAKASKAVKDIKDGKEALQSLWEGLKQLTSSLHLHPLVQFFQDSLPPDSLA